HRIILTKIERNDGGFSVRRHGDVADCGAADLLRRCKIALEMRRRDAEDARDIVESVACIVCGQHPLDVKPLNPQQFANGVLIFGAVETMQRFSASRVGSAPSSAVHLLLEPAAECFVYRTFWAPISRRRHGAAVQLTDDLLEFYRVLADIA